MEKKKQSILVAVIIIVLVAPFMGGAAIMLVSLIKLINDVGLHNITWGVVKDVLVPILVNLGVGGALLAAILACNKWQTGVKRLKELHPDSPWLWKKGWAEGNIKCMSTAGIWVIGIFALIWNLVSAPILLVAKDQVFDPNHKEGLFALIFPAVGVILIIVWLVQVARHRKFGDSWFKMASLPGVIGGKLAGVVHISKHVDPPAGFKLSLTCIKSVTTGSGKSQSTHKHVVHQEEMAIAHELLASDYLQTAIPILFGIPYNTPESGNQGPRVNVYWVLTVTASLPGADYNARFDVPVFKTAESAPDFKLDASALTGYVADVSPEDQLREHKITHRITSDSATFFFPMMRNPGIAFGLALGSAGWLATVIFLFKDPGGWPMGIIFALVGPFIWHWSLDLLFWSSRIEMRKGGIRLRYGMFGLNRCELPYEAVSDVVIKKGMQSGETLYHSIAFLIENGKKKKIYVGKRIRNRKVAEMLVDMYKQAIASSGREYRSGRDILRGGQHWFMGQTLLTRALFLGLVIFLVSLKFDIRSIQWKRDLSYVAVQLAKDNPEIKKDLKSSQVGSLNIAGDRSITNIDAISGMPLHVLDMGDTGVTDLTAIKGMKLRELSVWATPVSDISVVEGMPLQKLTLGHSPVSDISMLEGMKLNSLSITRTQITDISVLKGMPLTYLDMNDARVSDISALEGAPLSELMLNGLKIDDINVLKGMRLEKLWLAGTQVSDISVLEGMPLKNLWIQKTNVRDVSCLASCSNLEYILLDEGCTGIESLRKLPKLKHIGYDYGKEKPVREFWKSFDAQSSRVNNP